MVMRPRNNGMSAWLKLRAAFALKKLAKKHMNTPQSSQFPCRGVPGVEPTMVQLATSKRPFTCQNRASTQVV